MTKWKGSLPFQISLVVLLIWKMANILKTSRGKEQIAIVEITMARCLVYHRASRAALGCKIWAHSEQMAPKDPLCIQGCLSILLQMILNFLAVITKSESLEQMPHKDSEWMANSLCNSILTSQPMAQILFKLVPKPKSNNPWARWLKTNSSPSESKTKTVTCEFLLTKSTSSSRLSNRNAPVPPVASLNLTTNF